MASTRVSSRHGALSHHSSTTPTRCFMSENAALYAAPKHLPEPPESDPEVMLRSMPERGKLLQAVMQAGPLLHTLLLAGPLPRWRRPPPATPVDPMESNLMMQCCNKVGSSSINYNYSMPNSRFPIFPMSSSSAIGEGGASSSAEGSKSHPVKMSAAASTAATTWSMHMPSTSDSSTLAT